jgi:hypothetical protein
VNKQGRGRREEGGDEMQLRKGERRGEEREDRR